MDFHFGGIASWEPPFAPTLVLSLHPDDETLGAGGSSQDFASKVTPVTAVAITDGENAYGHMKGLDTSPIL
jgi:hypothetical protein